MSSPTERIHSEACDRAAAIGIVGNQVVARYKLKGNAVFPNNDGIAWIGSIIIAVVLVALYVRFLATGRGRARIR